MKLEDVIYINCLFFDRIEVVVGFSDSLSIIRSLIAYSATCNPRNDFSPLIRSLNNLGYEIKLEDEYLKISKAISTIGIPNRIELKYKNKYITTVSMSNNMKNDHVI